MILYYICLGISRDIFCCTDRFECDNVVDDGFITNDIFCFTVNYEDDNVVDDGFITNDILFRRFV